MSIFSLVVARAGSKGFKNKNVRQIGGKAVFEYTLDYSLHLNSLIDEEIFTIVSSDSDVIQKHCIKNNIPFDLRPSDLAKSSTPIEDVIYYIYKKINKDFDFISLLPANVITRYPDEFIKAYKFLKENKDYDCVFSVQNVEKFNPQQMFELNDKILPKKEMVSPMRQELKQFMILDGHTLLFRPRHFLEFIEEGRPIKFLFEAFGKKIKPMFNDELVIDIDTARDFELAKAYICLQEEVKK